MRSRHVSQVIHVEPEAVYAYAADPGNLPRWAAGLARSEIIRKGEDLVVEWPMGRVVVRFAPPNPYGVLDHDVTLPTGTTVHNPMRVIAHPEGAEVVFSVRQLAMSDQEFDRDTDAVAADLARLKDLVEAQAPA